MGAAKCYGEGMPTPSNAMTATEYDVDMIGSHRDARNATIIHTWKHSVLPKGWALIGRGTHRTAYLSPDGTVYKVGHSRTNRLEAVVLDELSETIPDNIPRHALYEVEIPTPDDISPDDSCLFAVMAMEYVEPDGTETTDNVAEILAAMAGVGALDLNPDNWVCRDGHLMLVDAGGVF